MCDNESLVDAYRLKKFDHIISTTIWEQQDDPESFESSQVLIPSVLVPDWDVLNMLFVSADDALLDAEWIKAHQDRKKPLHLLPLEAQLNCRADQLATQQHSFPTPADITIVPPMPAVPTQLVLADQTICSHHST